MSLIKNHKAWVFGRLEISISLLGKKLTELSIGAWANNHRIGIDFTVFKVRVHVCWRYINERDAQF